MHLIGLAGPAGAGKDTVADILVDRYGWRKFSFADELYREVAEAFGVTIEYLQRRETKEEQRKQIALSRCADWSFRCTALNILRDVIGRWPPDLIDAPRSPREILQRWGTDYRRAQDSDYWVKRARKPYVRGLVDGVPGMVNTSVRFSNEAEWVRSVGTVVHVGRPGYQPVNGHVSERPLPREWMDLSINNRADLCHLQNQIENMMDILCVGQREQGGIDE